ncbi:hypothetical protein [Leptospira bandrabouensis]|uniref:hypothetical protein n=1 Tax=Leptospira bandrabouensis TaxID=2484903 RepID=UPI001EEC5D2B|nr:hypothetical protein [Leptospira bandrabouensis]MCG6154024.1 hypothetical protein [Leptospira bandrabouensis]
MELIKFLSENKDGLEILISIFQTLGGFFIFLIGGFLAYVGLFREIKFSRIKELLSEQNDIKRKIREEAYKAKIYFESEMIGNDAKFAINKKLIIDTKNKLQNLFQLSSEANSDISNHIHLLHIFLNSCIEILKRDKEISKTHSPTEFWELVDEFHLYKYILNYLNTISLLTSKVEKVLSLWDIIKPNIKNKNFKFSIYFLTRTKRPKKSKIFESGVNFSYLSPYVLITTIYNLYFQNKLFPFTFFSTFELRNYIARALYKEMIYFPIEFEIDKQSLYQNKMKFKLFKIERNFTFFSKNKITKFHYFKEITYEKINSKSFFNALKRKENNFIIKDKYHPLSYKIENENIGFSNQYGGVNIITITIEGRFKLHLYLLKNLPFIFFDLLKKKD